MSKASVAPDPYKRHKTRYAGIFFRLRADGSRAYAVHFAGTWVPAGSTEKEALARQAELRRQKARGEKVVVNDRTTFAELCEQWLEGKAGKLRPRTLADYRASLDLVLLPRFGKWRQSAIDADAIAALIRGLEREGLHTVDPKRPLRPLGHAAITNYLKPLQGTLKLAVRRRLIAENPFTHLLADDRASKPSQPQPPHEWTSEEIETLLTASEALAAKPEARYNYTPLLGLTARLGLRLGEVLGLRWEDFDRNEGLLHIRRQWLRSGHYGPPKTRAGTRRIALPDDVRRDLIDQRLASKHSHDDHPIFASSKGTPLGHRNVSQRGFEAARDLAALPSSLSFHDLRHAAASRLIAAGIDPVTVASILGHEDPHVTLKVYSHLFNRHSRDEAIRAALAL